MKDLDTLLENATANDSFYAEQVQKLINLSRSAAEEAESWLEGIESKEIRECLEEMFEKIAR